MKINQLLTEIQHRPWALPPEGWKFYQEWNNAVFLHWEVDYKELRKHVPAGIEVDLYQGKPWVSLVAFTMENIRPRYLPPFSPISYFHEINIRTYTRLNSKTGVYFLSMEGSKWLACKVAKELSGLPYHYSKMERSDGLFISDNKPFDDHFSIDFRPGKRAAEKSGPDKWLTERYALHQESGNFINEFEVHHKEWPVQDIEIKALKVLYPRFGKLLSGTPRLQHYSPGVQALAWGKKKI